MSVANQRLSIYLNDHLAGAAGAIELARRSRGANRDGSLGQALEELTRELEEDQTALQDIMAQLGVRVDHAKLAAAWVAEKLGRFKLNGSLVSYSPLSRLEELELLVLGVEGKLLLWQALSRRNEPLTGIDLDALIKRAQAQRRRLNRHRLQAAQQAL
ncbi:MAG: hypothetical protein ACJ764_05350 [Solirubrobacteraceae bacterium]